MVSYATFGIGSSLESIPNLARDIGFMIGGRDNNPDKEEQPEHD
jgi:hypothetical protein